jgi:hypothetical protein
MEARNLLWTTNQPPNPFKKDKVKEVVTRALFYI